MSQEWGAGFASKLQATAFCWLVSACTLLSTSLVPAREVSHLCNLGEGNLTSFSMVSAALCFIISPNFDIYQIFFESVIIWHGQMSFGLEIWPDTVEVVFACNPKEYQFAVQWSSSAAFCLVSSWAFSNLNDMSELLSFVPSVATLALAESIHVCLAHALSLNVFWNIS